VIPLKDDVPTRTFPVVTVLLIAANFAVWLFYEVPGGQRAVFRLAFEPCEVQHACPDHGVAYPLDVFTAMFAHASWLHIIGNMLFLWVFGNNVEDAMGKARFVVFYFAAGLSATALQTWVTLTMGTTRDAAIPNVGASGAIAGVLGAYFILFPAARVITLLPLLVFLVPVEVPAVLFLGFWFLFQAWEGGFSLVAPGAGGGVAFFAHLGGFLFGVFAVRAFTWRRRRPSLPAWY
jgi:membrane associated rhomboid family serine protease